VNHDVVNRAVRCRRWIFSLFFENSGTIRAAPPPRMASDGAHRRRETHIRGGSVPAFATDQRPEFARVTSPPARSGIEYGSGRGTRRPESCIFGHTGEFGCCRRQPTQHGGKIERSFAHTDQSFPLVLLPNPHPRRPSAHRGWRINQRDTRPAAPDGYAGPTRLPAELRIL